MIEKLDYDFNGAACASDLYVHQNKINELVDYVNGLRESELTTKSQLRQEVKTEGCNTCGGAVAYIRGRHPHDDRRKVCPTCLQEKVEQIQDIASPDYGKVYTDKKGEELSEKQFKDFTL